MGNKHNKAFFGSKTAMIFSSSSKEDEFVYITCIRKKDSGDWEKTSLKEGKNIRLSLIEIIQLWEVFARAEESWSTVHKFEDMETKISFKWKDNELWGNINKYAKKFNIAETKLLKLIFDHLIEEKVKFGTEGKQKQS